MLRIDTLAYNSKLLRYSPSCKMAMGLASLILCIAFNTLWVSVLTIAAMGCVSAVSARLTVGRYIKFLLIPAGFLLLGTATIILCRLDGAGWALFRLMGTSYGVTEQSLRTGGLLILKSLGAVSCMYFVAMNTPMTDILSALRGLGVPALFVSLMELIYRYIFVILDEAVRMKTAQDSRLGYRGLKSGLRAAGELLGTLFIRCLARCDNIYVALQSRGYDGELRLLKQTYASSAPLWAAGLAFNIALAGVGILERGIIAI